METTDQTSLFAKICSATILLDAWRRIQTKGSQGGLDGVSVRSFGNQAASHLEDLRQVLLAGSYTPEPHYRIKVPKLNGTGKLRPLSLPTIKDKIVQEAVRRVIEPLFEPDFLPCSYAYRPGQGPRRAIGKAIHYIDHEKCGWAVHADFDKFFDTLDQEILLQRLQEKIKEPSVLKLIRMWLRIGSIGSTGIYQDTALGVGQGGILSPLLSNIYVHPLDVYLIDKGHRYIRYADNILILADSKSRVTEGLNDLTYFLQEMLKLRLNPEARPLRQLSEGFTFLGIHFKGRQRRLSEAKMNKIRRKLDWLTSKRRSQPLAQIIGKVQLALDGIRRYYTVINPQAQFHQLENYLKKRLIQLVAEHFRRGWVKKIGDAASPLSALTWLSRPDPKEHTKKAWEVARQARNCYQQIKSPTRCADSQASPTSLAVATAKGGTNLQAVKPPQTGPASPASPEIAAGSPQNLSATAELAQADQAVARQKRKYIKKLTVDTEVVVTTPGAFVGKKAGRLFIRRERKMIYSLPIIKVRGLTVHSHGVSISSDLIKALSDKQISLHLCTARGEPYAILHAPICPQATLSRLQLAAAQNSQGLLLAREFVIGKLRNQLNLLKFYLRARQQAADDPYTRLFPEKVAKINRCLAELDNLNLEREYDTVRSQLFALEGQAGAAYWAMVKVLLAPEIDYPGREHRGG